MPFAIAIFTSAFLLFQIQPLMGRYILPWFGGGPAVWTACMLFFQALLLGGYLYAHLISRIRGTRTQLLVHSLLLLSSLTFLPIAPDDSWRNAYNSAPGLWIGLLLLVTVSGPYLVLSASTPLLQRWFGLTHKSATPYRFYALSNAASFLGLLGYPLVIERTLGLYDQVLMWTILYCGYVATVLWCVVRVWRANPQTEAALDVGATKAPSYGDILYWVALSGAASLLLLATTNQITEDIAPIPLLWVIPLSLYLLSFVLCFDSQRWYHASFWKSLFLVSMFASVGLLVWNVQLSGALNIYLQFGVYSLVLFAGCMVLHGELARLKPAAESATLFYCSLALGGALGGLFASVVGPRIFQDYFEFHVALMLCYLLLSVPHVRARSGAWKISAGTLGVLLAGLLTLNVVQSSKQRIAAVRNFYGVLGVYEGGERTEEWVRNLAHGTLSHGHQMMSPRYQRIPIGYYSRESGIDAAFSLHPKRLDGKPLHYAVVGLGIGTIAAYGQPGDVGRFYEINPEVLTLARKYFTYLENSRSKNHVSIGDGRIILERELKQGGRAFDLLILDAFNSDAIPMHLITREAFDIYKGHLAPDGILAVHISTNHLDLSPVVFGLAKHLGMRAVRLVHPQTFSDWILVTNNEKFLAHPALKDAVTEADEHLKVAKLMWTDDFNNILQALK